MLGLLGAAVGASIGIASMWEKVMGSSLALSQFNAQTGLSVVKLQQWQNVGEAMGDTADNVASSLMSANSTLKNLQVFGTGAGSSAYALLGINPHDVKDVWSLLDILQKKLKSGAMDKTYMAARMQEMGLSGTWMKTLMANFDLLSNKTSVKTQEQIDRMVAVESKMKNLGQTITSVFNDIFVSLSPEILKVITSFSTWVQTHKKDIEGAFGIIGNGAGQFISNVMKITSSVNELINKTVGWKNAILGIAILYTAFDPFRKVLAEIFLLLRAVQFFQSLYNPITPEEEKKYGPTYLTKNSTPEQKQAVANKLAQLRLGTAMENGANAVADLFSGKPDSFLKNIIGVDVEGNGSVGGGKTIINNNNITVISDADNMAAIQRDATRSGARQASWGVMPSLAPMSSGLGAN